MPKYRVEVKEDVVASYNSVVIEADSREKAGEIAEEMRAGGYLGVSQESVVDVTMEALRVSDGATVTPKNPLSAAMKRMLDMSTSHLTPGDNDLMSGAICIEGPRIVIHQHGWTVFVCSDQALLAGDLEAMRESGASEAFCSIYEWAAKLGGDVMLINFDQDAGVIEGLPVFEW